MNKLFFPIVDFEQVNAHWVSSGCKIAKNVSNLFFKMKETHSFENNV